jgi:hypothetical protein
MGEISAENMSDCSPCSLFRFYVTICFSWEYHPEKRSQVKSQMPRLRQNDERGKPPTISAQNTEKRLRLGHGTLMHDLVLDGKAFRVLLVRIITDCRLFQENNPFSRSHDMTSDFAFR